MLAADSNYHFISNFYKTSKKAIHIQGCACAGLCTSVHPCANTACARLPSNTVFGCQAPSAIFHCDESDAVSITHLNSFFFFLIFHFRSFWGKKRTKAIIPSPNHRAIRRCECSWKSHQESFSQPSKLLVRLFRNWRASGVFHKRYLRSRQGQWNRY